MEKGLENFRRMENSNQKEWRKIQSSISNEQTNYPDQNKIISSHPSKFPIRSIVSEKLKKRVLSHLWKFNANVGWVLQEAVTQEEKVNAMNQRQSSEPHYGRIIPQNPMPTSNMIAAPMRSLFACSGLDFNLISPTTSRITGVNQ